MTPWTAFLESFHSALVDELVERLPNAKPELGMPIRAGNREFPSGKIRSAHGCQFNFSTAQEGLVLFAFEEAALADLKTDYETLWASVLKKVGSELLRRQIKPRLGNAFVLKEKAPLPSGTTEPSRMIWIPFRLPQGTCYLGMGVV